ncbi:MAG: hypothetical protein RIR12_102 [Bacteroidota bacterium]|jgi:iron complex outermembrane receptor protein
MLIRITTLLVSVFISLSLQSQCTLQYAGKITDGDTKEILKGAVVTLKDVGVKALTDSNGNFMIKGLCAGHYDVIISHVGCQPLLTHIHINDDYEKWYELPHAVNQLEAVKVMSHNINVVNPTEIKGAQLDALKGLSLGETIKNIPGVSLLQTGTNIYKPAIHGLHSSRVLIINNGIRQEGQQWGNEHAPEIDANLASRISVIKGAGTIRYGGDAIGGVVLVEPKLLRLVPGIGGEVNVAAFSNNRQLSIAGILDGNLTKNNAISWRLQGTIKKGGNSKTPQYWLDNSGLEEYNFSAAVGYKKTNWSSELFYSQFNTKLGIFSGAHIGNLTDLMTAINSTTPPDYITNVGFTYRIDRPYQKVQHHLLKSKTLLSTGAIGRINVTASFQYNNRLEYDKKRFQSSEDVPQLDLSIATAGLDIIWDYFGHKKMKGTVGLVGSFQDNQYSRRLFIPNYQSVNGGGFITNKWTISKWAIEYGMRYDYRKIFNTTDNAGNRFSSGIYSSLSGSLGAAYVINSTTKLSLNASTAWRSPNVNELYSDGLHHGAARIEKGNANLQPERANTFLSELNINAEKWTIETGAYFKYIKNFIFLQPSYPPQLTIRGAFPAFIFSQTNAALYGFDVSLGYNVSHHLQVNTKTSILRAMNKRTDEWLIQMPADRYQGEVTYTFNNRTLFKETYMRLTAQAVNQQKRIPKTGPIEISRPDGSIYYAADYAPPPQAYFLLGAEVGTTLSLHRKDYSIIISASNLLNHVYRDYMNAFRYYADEMGRYIAIRIKVPFAVNNNPKNKNK